jgi:hypothetical protein
MANLTTVFHHIGGRNRSVTAYLQSSAPVTTDWVCLTGNVGVQVSGAATAITYTVQRSSLDPAGQLGADAVPADVAVSGNPSTGMQAQGYIEPGVGWWRVVVSAVTGNATVSISGYDGAA